MGSLLGVSRRVEKRSWDHIVMPNTSPTDRFAAASRRLSLGVSMPHKDKNMLYFFVAATPHKPKRIRKLVHAA